MNAVRIDGKQVHTVTSSVERMARLLWSFQHSPIGWERLKPEVQAEFFAYAAQVIARDLRGKVEVSE